MDNNQPKHTPEPWVSAPHPNCRLKTWWIMKSGEGAQPVFVERIRKKEDAARIVACVNAMAGHPDPAAYVKRATILAQDNNEQRELIADLTSQNIDLLKRNEILSQQVNNQAETIRRLRDPLGKDQPPFPPTEQLLRDGNV